MRTNKWLVALLWLGGGCGGGQTGQPGSGPLCTPDEVVGADAEQLFAKLDGRFEGLGVRSDSDARCPEGELVTLSAVVRRAVGDVDIADKPCGARFAPATVELSSSDGSVDGSIDGWLGEDGVFSSGEQRLVLEADSHELVGLGGFEPLRYIEPCCAARPSDDLVAAVRDLGASAPLDLEYWDADRNHFETRLAVSLAAPPPSNACDTFSAAFELRDSQGALAGSGDASVTYSTCRGQGCLALQVEGQGSVDDQQVLLGDQGFPSRLTQLTLSFGGRSGGAALSIDSFRCEATGDGDWGAALSLKE